MADEKLAFTPGPWTVDGTVALGAYGVWTAEADARNPGHDGTGYQVQICSMNPMDRNTPITKDERGANARLISASPDMLAVLTELMEFWDHGTAVHAGAEIVGEARAAIARAKGTTNA